MLTLQGQTFTCCEKGSRRDFLRIGSLGLGGLTLPYLLQTKAVAGKSQKTGNKSVIFVQLAGGPSQFDTYDPKPYAPIEFRGPLGAVSTNLPGVQFGELMREQSKVADRMAIVRSIHHDSNSHRTSTHLTKTGYYLQNTQAGENEMPAIGAITSRQRGANRRGLPAYANVPGDGLFNEAAYLGKQFDPLASGNPNDGNFEVKNLARNTDLTLDRMSDRRHLLKALDARRKWADLHGLADAYGEFANEAFEMVTSQVAQRAFDIGSEPDAVRERYGRTRTGQSMLLARRLVEAGVTFINVGVGGWDMHTSIEPSMRKVGTIFDQGLAALIEEIYERGLDRDVLVVVMGEFGRTPRVNKAAGRDHWGALMSVALSGGGLRVGKLSAPHRPMAKNRLNWRIGPKLS